MLAFIQRFAGNILGVLHGFDRVRLRGTKRLLAHVGGMLNFLWQEQVLLKHFKSYAKGITQEVRQAGERVAMEQGRPVEYLASSKTNKEAWAKEIAQRDGIRQGLIGVVKCVEPCRSYEVGPNRDKKELELRSVSSKCLHFYHYFQDPELGLLHVRLQTWFPFTVQVCLNGREWLARQMDKAGMRYQKRENCFVWIEDWERAQQLLAQQLRTDWPALMTRLTNQANPALAHLFAKHPVPYYWSMDETEWASDVAFRSTAALAELAPRLYRHSILCLSCRDVMRFMGRKLDTAGERFGRFSGEVVSDLKQRPEGMRVKHRLNGNWVKMYDKQGSVLRVETVINDASDMKAFRPKEGDERGEKDWRKLRKGVADAHRRAEISQATNERYLEALATVEDTTPLAELTDKVCQRVYWNGHRHRALNPLAAEDSQLLDAVNRGDFTINGFRNSDLRALLYPKPAEDPKELRRQSAAITRKLRLLRAHGLIRKLPKSHRYQVSKKGRQTITAIVAARQANTAKFSQAA
jgi:hypothetical protein